ncbi:putative flavonol 3-sulfotransferase [Helianthus annuus]|nr:putative flavonol 3-sulfotransferase [Helianthus annuus]
MSSCKFVYVCRDPKDVLISKWHFMSKLRSKDQPPLSLDEAFELFCQGVSEYGPFWEHVLSYWRVSLELPDKILFLKYEEMKKQPEVVVKKLAAFMEKPFTAEEERKGVVGDIVKLCSFENLSNLEVNKTGVEKFANMVEVENRDFFRKGEVGDWKNYLSEEMKERIDRITDEKLRGSGLILTTTV